MHTENWRVGFACHSPCYEYKRVACTNSFRFVLGSRKHCISHATERSGDPPDLPTSEEETGLTSAKGMGGEFSFGFYFSFTESQTADSSLMVSKRAVSEFPGSSLDIAHSWPLLCDDHVSSVWWTWAFFLPTFWCHRSMPKHIWAVMSSSASTNPCTAAPRSKVRVLL